MYWLNVKVKLDIFLGSIQLPKNTIYRKAHYLPKSTEKTHAMKGLYALWITILCVLDKKDVYMWQEKVYDPKTWVTNDYCVQIISC